MPLGLPKTTICVLAAVAVLPVVIAGAITAGVLTLSVSGARIGHRGLLRLRTRPARFRRAATAAEPAVPLRKAA